MFASPTGENSLEWLVLPTVWVAWASDEGAWASVRHRSLPRESASSEQPLANRFDPAESKSDQLMDQLRLFVSLRALTGGEGDPEALRAVQAELERLEKELATAGEAPEPFRLDQEDLDNLFLLKTRQSLEPEGKIGRLPPVRWYYRLARRLLLGTQRRYNESVTYLVRRLYSTALLTRYYQLRSLALERRLGEIEERLKRLESDPSPQRAEPSSPPPEPRP